MLVLPHRRSLSMSNIVDRAQIEGALLLKVWSDRIAAGGHRAGRLVERQITQPPCSCSKSLGLAARW